MEGGVGHGRGGVEGRVVDPAAAHEGAVEADHPRRVRQGGHEGAEVRRGGLPEQVVEELVRDHGTVGLPPPALATLPAVADAELAEELRDSKRVVSAAACSEGTRRRGKATGDSWRKLYAG